jgi:tRNA-binding EMAP/Myf-like protein
MNSETNYVENSDIIVCQNFEAVRIPRSDPLYKIEIASGTDVG